MAVAVVEGLQEGARDAALVRDHDHRREGAEGRGGVLIARVGFPHREITSLDPL